MPLNTTNQSTWINIDVFIYRYIYNNNKYIYIIYGK